MARSLEHVQCWLCRLADPGGIRLPRIHVRGMVVCDGQWAHHRPCGGGADLLG
jgi:hypothetical protein